MSKEPHVFQLVHDLSISGASLHVTLLCRELSRMGYRVSLVYSSGEHEADFRALAEKYAPERIVLPHLDARWNPAANANMVRHMADLLREQRPTIVHTHSLQLGLLMRIAARMSAVPVVVHTMHMHPFRGYYNRQQTLFFTIAERLGAYFSDSILTLSEDLRNELVERYHITQKNRINVLPLGYDLERFASQKRHAGAFRAAWDIPRGVPLIGAVGRLLPVKHLDLFLRMASIVLARHPDCHFVIVGGGPEEASLMAMATSLGIRDRVIFTGWFDEMPSVYADLDVLVNTSWNEGMPVPLIEALAAGCPVVATDVGGNPSLLDYGQIGRLVPSDDIEALTEAIFTILDTPPDPEAGRAAVLDRYDIKRLVIDLDSLYRGLLAKKRAEMTRR